MGINIATNKPAYVVFFEGNFLDSVWSMDIVHLSLKHSELKRISELWIFAWQTVICIKEINIYGIFRQVSFGEMQGLHIKNTRCNAIETTK